MVYCANCGASVEGKFCPKCGTAIGVAPTPGAAPAGAVPVSAGGLDENIASALCYLAGLITGVLFLVLAPYNQNRTIRFHAFQSIFFHVGVIIIWMALFTVMMIFRWTADKPVVFDGIRTRRLLLLALPDVQGLQSRKVHTACYRTAGRKTGVAFGRLRTSTKLAANQSICSAHSRICVRTGSGDQQSLDS
jgi:uncharacterized membrane protein